MSQVHTPESEREAIENERLQQRVHALKSLLFGIAYGGQVQIEIGSIVRLNSGGPEMTVIDIEQEDGLTYVNAMLFDSDGEPHELELPAQCWALKVYVV